MSTGAERTIDETPIDDAAPDGAPSIEGAAIAGTVTDFAGVPLVGVRVEAAATAGADLDLLPVLTDGDGRFELPGLAEAHYDLRFALGTVKARTLAVPVGTTDLGVRLARPQGILLVARVVAGERLPRRLHVVLERRAQARWVRAYFGVSLRERLLMWSIRPGTYRMRVWGGPFLPVEVDGIEVRDGEAAPTVEVCLGARGATVTGRVLDANGAPRAGLVCWRALDRPDGAPPQARNAVVGSDGAFALRGLDAGRYLVAAWSQAGDLGEIEIDVRDEATHEADVVVG